MKALPLGTDVATEATLRAENTRLRKALRSALDEAEAMRLLLDDRDRAVRIAD